MLELAVEAHVDLVTAAKIALGSMLSTAAANLSVGPPYDIGFYFNETRTFSQFRIDNDSPCSRSCRRCGSAISSTASPSCRRSRRMT